MELQKSAEQSPIARQKQMKRIVDAVFSNEAAALKYPKDRMNDLRARYEDYVSSITATVHDQVPNLKIEREVFDHLASVFYSNFNYADGKLVMTGLESSPSAVNCYGSSLMFADVLSRLNVKFEVVKAPGHVLLLGNKYGFETTVEEGESMFYETDLKKLYPIHQIGGVEMLLSAAYLSVGSYLVENAKNGAYSSAIASYKKALDINPKDPEALYDLGIAYSKAGQYDNSIDSYRKALLIDKDNGNIYFGMGTAYYHKKEYGNAISSYQKSLKTKKRSVSDSVIYESIGKSYEADGDLKIAGEYYKKAGISR